MVVRGGAPWILECAFQGSRIVMKGSATELGKVVSVNNNSEGITSGCLLCWETLQVACLVAGPSLPLTLQVLAAKALRRAYGTHSASAMRIALGAAYSAGVDRMTLEEGERCLKERR